MLDRIKIIFRDSAIKIFEKYLSGKSLFTKPNTLVIIRLDGIGDYVLFRNLIKEIKESEIFKNYRITLLGNEIWKDLAEGYDKNYIDKFIWINKQKFWSKAGWAYRYTVLFKLHYSGYELLIRPNDTRKHITEYISKYSGAKKIITKESDSLFFHNKSYSESVISENESNHKYENTIFQFYRNKYFIEEVTGKNITLKKPYFDIQKENVADEYIVIFPGAGNETRMWSAANFADICNKIMEVTNNRVIICGDNSDTAVADKIIEKVYFKNIEDRTGGTSLTDLVRIITNAKLLISNDTGAAHIGAAVNTKTICISNGNHFGRFHPYPKEISELIKTIYPQEVMNDHYNFEKHVKRFYINSDLDINSISPELVFEYAMDLIGSDKKKV